MEQNEETPIELDLSIETVALLNRSKPVVEPPGESVPIRTCGGCTEASPPTCCP